jgi:hypothetical protein
MGHIVGNMRHVKFMWKKVDENIFVALETTEEVRLNVYFFQTWLWMCPHLVSGYKPMFMVHWTAMKLSTKILFIYHNLHL